jgi:hypothetical protein
MSDGSKVEVNAGMGWFGLFIVLVLVYGDPDLLDAMIFYLSDGDADALKTFTENIHTKTKQ